MKELKPIKDTTLDCMNDLIGDLEHYEQWFNNEEHCKDELKWLKGWSERVKNDLTELQAIKEAKPSEALEDLKELHELAYGNDETSWKIDEIRMSSHIKATLLKAEKLEKAWEIVKEKRVDLPYLRCCIEDNQNVERYNEYIRNKTMDYDHEQELTQQEFDLLKEVLE
jgi:hypothetical protein